MRAHRLLFVLLGFLAALPRGVLSGVETVWPDSEWPDARPEEVGLDAALLEKARDYALTGDGSGIITRHGRVVLHWGDLSQRYDLKSTTKSIGVTALGVAIADRKLGLDDLAHRLHPSFGTPPDSNDAGEKKGWIERITLRHLATHTAGFRKPGGYEELFFAPGTRWAYSDGGPNWLAECITLAYERDLEDLLFERVFTPIGIGRDDLRWRRNAYRDAEIQGIARREFGAGVHANVDAMARIGYLYLREGRWRDRELVPKEFIVEARTTQPSLAGLPVVDEKEHGGATSHYGLLWWTNGDGALANVPRDAYWSWGLYDSLIVVIPSLDIVVARAGKSWKRTGGGHYFVLAPFLEPIVAAAREERADEEAGAAGGEDERETEADEEDDVEANGTASTGHAPSPVIRTIEWAPKSTIVRKARGSDNWPITWGDDDRLYTAYGDGRGFEPFVERKLSMGLAVITGGPVEFEGANLRSPSFERTGDGARGPKASGLLMVDGTLYALIRNTENSQLAWSADRGKTWAWADWRFETSFGYPTFLNFGKNYQGARDDHVYLYSMDSESAYERADRMVLARVPKDEIARRESYEFFEKLTAGEPTWTRDIARRGAVFELEGACYRSSVSYSAPLRRYLWCQTGLGEDPRDRGGFAIYDAPEPWGPWTTVDSSREWDVGPGETSCLPVKWMSDDGLTVHLVFSGDDSFSVRRGEVRLR